MTDPETGPTYRFKWTNYDMERMIAERRSCAASLRRNAATLIVKAEQIEEEAEKWSNVLEIVEGNGPSASADGFALPIARRRAFQDALHRP